MSTKIVHGNNTGSANSSLLYRHSAYSWYINSWANPQKYQALVPTKGQIQPEALANLKAEYFIQGRGRVNGWVYITFGLTLLTASSMLAMDDLKFPGSSSDQSRCDYSGDMHSVRTGTIYLLR